MKSILSSTIFLLLLLSCKKDKVITQAQRPNCIGNTWQTSSFFYGDKPFNSSANIPFSLVHNNKIYVFDVGEDEVRIFNGTGWDSISSAVPFASFDVPNFGFTIGDKGYLGNIDINSLTHPFWEYDFALNTWEQKANFPGVRRNHGSAANFTIGNKGYVVGGLSESNSLALTLRDTWAYLPENDEWIPRANLPIANRVSNARGFGINGKGYVVNGQYITETTTANLKQLVEYDTLSNTWTAKTQFPGSSRYWPSVFVISNYAYVGGGRTITTFFTDFHRYSPGSDTWTDIADITVTNPSIYGYTLSNKGYVEVKTTNSSPNFLMKYSPKSCIVPIQQ